MLRALHAAAALLGVLALATPALAQESAPASAPPPSVTVTSTAPPGQGTSTVRTEPEDDAHFRFGFGLDGNYLLTPGPNKLQGAGVGAQLRLGAQMNEWFGVYYQAHGLVGGSFDDAGNLQGAGLFGMLFNSGIVELTLPLLHIGVGPSADVVGVADVVGRSTSVNFGADGHVALVLGGHGPGHHAGLAITASAHPTFWDGTVLTTFSLGLGGELY